MADEHKEQTDKAVQSPIEGMDPELLAAADRYVESKWLDRQRESIQRARDRALGIYKDYRDDAWFRAEASVRISLAINLFYSVYQVYMGFRYDSVWFGSLAIYSIMVTTARAIILRYLRPDAKDGREELERYRNCGYLLIMLTFAVMLLAMIVNFVGEHPVYPGSMIYVVAGFTIYTVVTSIMDLIAYRKLESPLISASKAVAVACALVSLYSLQAAAVALYCVGDYAYLRGRLNSFSAFVICIVIFWFAVHIINRASRALAGKEDLSFVVAESAKAIQEDNRIEWQEHAAEAQRQLEYWRGKDKVEWRTQGGAWERHDEEIQERLRQRDERRRARKKKKGK